MSWGVSVGVVWVRHNLECWHIECFLNVCDLNTQQNNTQPSIVFAACRFLPLYLIPLYPYSLIPLFPPPQNGYPIAILMAGFQKLKSVAHRSPSGK